MKAQESKTNQHFARVDRSVIWLADVSSQDPSVSGNKAANLARLMDRGFLVPDGFCVTAGHTDRSLWEDEVRAALGQLPSPWAVRSSSTAEDSETQAFPGMFLTVLGLRSPDDVVTAIERVMASASEEVVSRYSGEPGTKFSVPVLVQPLVDASAAGVAFTRHPVNQQRVVFIEAGLGLGETVVDGSTTPDTLEVAEDDTVTLVRQGSKRQKMVLVDGELVRVPVEAGSEIRALGDDEAREVARIAREIEASFGAPQDVEWALDQQRGVIILQARPITTAGASPRAEPPDAISTPPPGVEYALTVPQSVLFTDLCLQGNTAAAFRAALGIEHEPRYISYDNGMMSWDYSINEPFLHRLGADVDGATAGILRFVDLMGRTSRGLVRAAEALGPAKTRIDGSIEQVLADLRVFWDAYELHMTSLFTFWNVEALLTKEIQDALSRAGRGDEAGGWLARLATPAEKNYFVLEQESLDRIRERFSAPPRIGPGESRRGLLDAIDEHATRYGFLFAPYNLSLPPDAQDYVDRLAVGQDGPSAPKELVEDESPTGDPSAAYSRLPSEARLMGLLAAQMAFWKTERLDTFALADAQAADLYAQAADLLGVGRLELFTMTRAEIEESLGAGAPIVAAETRAERAAGYARVLHDGQITFYQPSAPRDAEDTAQAEVGAVLKGMSGATGLVEGRVRIVVSKNDLSALEPGEILVTPMTRVEMGVALDRAAAFVTDEGGIICHAAIIGREKRKPCVIGTGNATSVLRNGMQVRIDGDAGLVQVL